MIEHTGYLQTHLRDRARKGFVGGLRGHPIFTEDPKVLLFQLQR